jgi:hypothetical protein
VLLALRRRRGFKSRSIQTREVASFDASVDSIARRTERAGRIAVGRSADYLNWRFARNPRCRYRLLAGFKGSVLVGYVVTRFNLSRPNPSRQAEIVDWLIEPGPDEREGLMQLFHDAVAGLVADGAGVVACMCSPGADHSAVRDSGFRLRPDETLPFFVRAASETLHARLTAAADWSLTLGDFDVE